MSFANLKKQSKLGSLTEKLVKEVEKMNSSGGSADERFWKLECDKANNGYAVIRFLPAPDGEDLPFVKVYSHAFQGPGCAIECSVYASNYNLHTYGYAVSSAGCQCRYVRCQSLVSNSCCNLWVNLV